MTETSEQKARRELDVKLLVSGWIVQNRDEIDLTARLRQAPTSLRRVALHVSYGALPYSPSAFFIL